MKNYGYDTLTNWIEHKLYDLVIYCIEHIVSIENNFKILKQKLIKELHLI